ncbi:BatD family protein [Microvirga lotononidis]|uniref:DUF7939 domain-containing protein n=1 Tax=Microvirga lotononidis TaxID=864069 RepID=I4YN21_9HYPH|nr:BatD family protein [Microvirga lotononidis]EIM25363.1 hypothetical protein MicloDRAFT_00060890 [Microvirga lotononidis]WQO27336.1 BatD family protein [Microvirga lotononidis]
MPALALGLIVAASPALSQPSGVAVRTALDPAGSAVVGQPISLYVDVLFPDVMPRPPRVSVADAPGTQVMRFESQGLTIRETIGQQSYVGQRFTFAVFPRRGGRLTVPAPQVTLLDPGGDVAGTTAGSPVGLDVTVPPGIDASGPVIASSRVSARQTWSPDEATRFETGGALVRAITREAADVPALGMPELSFAVPDGIRIYPDPPVSEDRVDRGSVTGHRTDKVTYVFERAGTFVLPALVLPWWDLRTKSAQAANLEGRSVTVTTPATPAASRAGFRIRSRTWLLASAGLAAILATVVIAAWYGAPGARQAWLAWRQRRAASEKSARRTLRRVARGGDAAATYRAFAEWKTRLSPSQIEWVSRNEALGTAAAQLERSLFGPGGEPWTPERGWRLAEAAWSVPNAHARVRRPCALPPLNPVGRS